MKFDKKLLSIVTIPLTNGTAQPSAHSVYTCTNWMKIEVFYPRFKRYHNSHISPVILECCKGGGALKQGRVVSHDVRCKMISGPCKPIYSGVVLKYSTRQHSDVLKVNCMCTRMNFCNFKSSQIGSLRSGQPFVRWHKNRRLYSSKCTRLVYILYTKFFKYATKLARTNSCTCSTALSA